MSKKRPRIKTKRDVIQTAFKLHYPTTYDTLEVLAKEGVAVDVCVDFIKNKYPNFNEFVLNNIKIVYGYLYEKVN